MKVSSIIPTAELELADLADRIADRWLTEPNYLLSYINAADFKVLTTSFKSAINTRTSDGDSRAVITMELRQLDTKINNSIKYLKGYLDEKYDTDAQVVAKYGQFGIDKIGSVYKMPTDRNARRSALGKIVAALAAEGFGTKKYGTAYWTPIITQYNALCSQAVTTDGAVSVQVGNKTAYKKQIRQALSALHALIKIQNPDNYKAVLRSWGFQKEKM